MTNDIKQRFTITSKLKLFVFSIIGIIFFFIPVIQQGEKKSTPMVFAISKVKGFLAPILPILLIVSTFLLVIFCIIAKFTNKSDKLTNIYGKTSNISLVLYVIGAILSIMIHFNLGPETLMAKSVGPGSFGIASSVLVTIMVAGVMVVLISEFGFLEFLGTLIEPLMRPIFKVPGYASIDAITSFVANPTVGIYFTSKLYTNKKYTTREASAISTNFSIISLGFFMVLAESSGLLDYYGQIVISAFIISFIMAAIIIRIPPISSMPDTYIDGSQRAKDQNIDTSKPIFVRGYEKALEKAESVNTAKAFKDNAFEVLIFSQRVAVYILTISVITMLLVENTNLFMYLGKPFIPILNLFNIPDASQVAPGILLGLAEVALPAAYIGTTGVTASAAFFLVILTSVQIMMFSNSIPSILESEIPLKMWQLLLIFFVRTLIAIPIAAIFTKVIF